jgi:hypothetical protein
MEIPKEVHYNQCNQWQFVWFTTRWIETRVLPVFADARAADNLGRDSPETAMFRGEGR